MDNKAYLDMINSEEYIKLYNYYNQKTFMDVLGSSRRENDHSNFLAWLFNPSENHGMGDYPLRKLLQTIAFRCNKSGYKSTNPQNFLNTKNIACLNNLIYDDFEIESARISREYPTINKQRLDLYIELEIKFESEKKLIFLLKIK